MTATKSNPFFKFFAAACVIWLLVIGVVVALFFGLGGRPRDFFLPFLDRQGGTPAASLSDRLSSIAYQPLANALSKMDPNLVLEPIPGKPGTFKLTDKASGQSTVLDLAALRQLAQGGGDSASLAKLLQPQGTTDSTTASTPTPATPAADPATVPAVPTAPPAEAPADSAAPAATPIPLLPDWFPKPEGSKLAMHVPTGEGGTTGGSFLLTTSQATNDVAKFYEDKLKAVGSYAVERRDLPSDGGTPAGSTISATQADAPNRVIQMTITPRWRDDADRGDL